MTTMQLLMGMPIPIPNTQRSPNMMKKKQTTNGKGTLKAKSAEVVSQAVTTKGGTKKTSPDTHGIEFLAVGRSKKGGKFLLVAKDDKHVVLSVRNSGRDPSAELERLEALDVHLLVPQRAQGFPSARPKSCEDGADVRRRDADRMVRRCFSSSRIAFIRLSLPSRVCRRGGRGSWCISTPRMRIFIPAFVAAVRRRSLRRYFDSAVAIPV